MEGSLFGAILQGHWGISTSENLVIWGMVFLRKKIIILISNAL
jgi:hypothetical protein